MVDVGQIGGLFGSHVSGCPAGAPLHGRHHVVVARVRVSHPRQAEIGDSDPSGRIDQQIRRLDVAVQDLRIVLVCVSQAARRLPDVVQGQSHRERSFAFYKLVEILALHELHHKVVDSVLFVRGQRADNIRMLTQLGGCPHLAAQEAFSRADRRSSDIAQHLQRIGCSKPRMAALVHFPHAAGADFVRHFVLAEHQYEPLSGKDRFPLVLRQQFLRGQRLRQRRRGRIRRLPEQIVEPFLSRRVSQQAGISQTGDKLLRRQVFATR